MHVKNQIKKTPFTIAIVFSMAAFFSTQVVSETISYASDELTIPMRSGTSPQHRITRFIKSGTALKVLEASEDSDYSLVSTPDGKEGWVKNSDMMGERGARERLVSANDKLNKSRETVKQLKKTMTDLKTESRTLSKQLAASEKKSSTLDSDFAYFKKVTANPIALASENRTLVKDIKTVTTQNQQLKSRNERLSDDSTKDWFIRGAVVALGSLLLGLLITRIRWQKKSWGDL